MKFCISIFLLCLAACDHQKSDKASTQAIQQDSLPFSNNAFICFDSSFSGKKGLRIYRLGDSIKQILNVLDLVRVYPSQDTLYVLQSPFIKNTKSGVITTNIFAYFRNEILHRFLVLWTFKGNFIDEARAEFYSVVQNSTMGCLWEESIDIYKSSDTLKLYYDNKTKKEYVSSFSDSSWKIQFDYSSSFK